LVAGLSGGGIICSMARKIFIHDYYSIISVENLLLAWREFVKGKKNKHDVQEFGIKLMDNIVSLHDDLVNKKYKHAGYYAFNISDPKPRNIHKAGVRDRLLHHAIYRKLYPFFDMTFIADSYSCRIGKGTHKAIERFKIFSAQASVGYTKTCWVLKCDIRKFFASIDQEILLFVLKKYIFDIDTAWLLERIIYSFYSTKKGKGLPLGNLTSQLLVNIYMNEFDQFVKHKLKAKYYIRYADDFVVLSENKQWLEKMLAEINDCLSRKLKLQLHPDKVYIKTLSSGVDFLGWVNFPDHKVLRTVTKRKMFRNIKLKEGKRETMQSYLGMLGHGNAYRLKQKIIKI